MSEQNQKPEESAVTDDISRLACALEADQLRSELSQKRWELIIHPSLFAFVLLALYGFYLVYNLQKDVHYLAISVDSNMTTLASNMQNISQNMGQLTSNVRAMTVSLDSIDKKVGTLEPMLTNMTNLTQAAQGMNINMHRMNRDIGRPMRMMNTFMPW